MAMATGGRERTGADLAVSVTGIAGPDGGSPSKPVGLTYVAVADGAGVAVRRYVWSGDRAENKRHSAAAALELLLERVEADGSVPLPPPADATPRRIPPPRPSPHDLRLRSGRGRAPAGPPGSADPVRRADPRRRGCRGRCERRGAPGGPCRRHRHRLRSGRAVAVHARPRGDGDRRRARTLRGPRHGRVAPGSPGGHEGADRDRSGQPELVAARDAGHPGRAVAAGRRRRGSRPDARRRWPGRTARARPRAGWSTSSSRRAPTRRRSSARCCRRRSPAVHRPRLAGGAATRSSSRPTSTPATSMPTSPASRS